MVTTFLPSQIGNFKSSVPLTYTSDPFRLLWSDIRLFCRCLWAVPNILLPLTPCLSGALDELYPSRDNIFCIGVHVFLCVFQLAFIISVPVSLCLLIPFSWFSLYATGFLVLNGKVCDVFLNGPPFLESKTDLSHFPSHDNERWIFLNGVAAG